MNEKINMQEFIHLLAEKHGISYQEVELFINEFFGLIEEGLEQDRYVKVKGLGTFKLIEVDSRESVDVNTGERIEIQGHTKVSFTPENALKEIVNRPFSHFEAVVLNDNVNFDDMSEENDETEHSSENTCQVKSEVPVAVVEEDVVADCHEENVKEVREQIVEEKESFPVQEEVVVNEPVASANTALIKNSRGGNLLMWIIVSIIFICAGITISLYWNNLFPDANDRIHVEKEEVIFLEDTSLKSLYEPEDSLASDQTDSLDSPKLEQKTVLGNTDRQGIAPEKTPVKKTVQAVSKSFVPDSVGYTIIGTETSYTMREGETLAKVSLRFFGTKALWPYIVKHNAGVIKNPDNVPYGTVIQIPKLKKKQ